MNLDRDDILRDDFPTARKGYDPEAVRAHLRSVADAVRDRTSTPLAETAADRVGSILEAAEMKAAEIEAEARSEAERLVNTARVEAEEQVDRAQGAVSRLVEQANDLRSAVGKLGLEITSQVGSPSGGQSGASTAETTPEVVPQPPRIPEPTPPQEPEPQPPQTPEPTPPTVPEPSPPTVPEPTPPSPQIRAGSPSTEDLLAQLKGEAGVQTPAANGGESAAEGVANGEASGRANEADVAAARLVAMKMALEGASRDEIERHLEANYSISSTDKLLDDVLVRAKP